MKKTIAVLLLTGLVLGCLAGCTLGGSASEETVAVQSVGLITGIGAAGSLDRFAGKIVSGETAKIKKDTEKTVLEVKVEVGDWVDAGDVLFTYDTQAMELALEKLQLELQGYQNTITSGKSEIEELEAQKKAASSDNKLAYTLQIDAKNADISEAEYNSALKQREITNMQADLEKTDVTAPIGGMVTAVNEADSNENQSYYGSGETDDSFITIMDMNTYRVEGTINEMNRGVLTEGMPVVIRSRIDDTVTWKGSIESIDWENPVSNNSDNGGVVYYGGSTDEMTVSTKYPFYVALEDREGMIFGQHVYIEPDFGQEEEQPVMQLPAWYICDADSAPYVWAMSAKQTLEKRSVTLGAYIAELDVYEILDGLTAADYIAFPDDSLKAGAAVSIYDENSFGSGEMGTFESGSYDFGTMESGSYDFGTMESGSYGMSAEPSGAMKESEPFYTQESSQSAEGENAS